MSETAELLKPKELAGVLHYSVSTINLMARRGKIPFYGPATARRFDLDEVKRALKSKQDEPVKKAAPVWMESVYHDVAHLVIDEGGRLLTAGCKASAERDAWRKADEDKRQCPRCRSKEKKL